MKLEESFEVDAPVNDVWRALVDVQRVAPCLPGAEITEAGDDGTYHGNFQVKLGPTTAAYTGTLKLESVDEAARVATMSANGRDKRGQGGAKATMVSTVVEAEGGGARVHVDTDFTITGRLARFGRGGMIQDISKRLLADFAACLQEELRAAPASGAPPGGRGDAPAAPGDAAPPVPAAADEEGEPGRATDAGGSAAVGPSAGSAPAGQSRPAPPARRRETRPVRGFSLLVSVLRDRLRRWLSRRRR